MQLPSILVRVSTGERFSVSEVAPMDGGQIRIVGAGEIRCDHPEEFVLSYAGSHLKFTSDLRGRDEWVGRSDPAVRLYL